MSHLLPTFAWLKNLAQGMSVRASFLPGVLVAITSMPFAAVGANVTLSWNPSSNELVTGYNIYYGTASGDYSDRVSTGNTTSVTLSNLVEGTTYFFAATAYDASGQESPFSNEASYTVLPGSPSQPAVLTSATNSSGQFSFQLLGAFGKPYVIEASTDLLNWEPVLTNVAPAAFAIPISSEYSQRFFRAYYSSALDAELSPAILTSVMQTNGQFSFTVSGVADYEYTVEASTNLVDWVQVATDVSPFTFTTTNLAELPQQFFRAVYVP
jgi:hypothetical protein